ncbi:MAG: AMP-binding protein [Bacteroidales bacterium]|nr:AMP-binding protein [Bacteroidales bacterium]
MKHFLNYLHTKITAHWDEPGLTDYGRETFTNGQIAENIEKLHILFEKIGLEQGDRVSISGRNSARWAMAFLAVETYGCVAVPVLSDFTPENIQTLCEHSESKLLFTDLNIWEHMNPKSMKHVKAVLSLAGYQFLYASNKKALSAGDQLDKLFKLKYPAFRAKDINYKRDDSSLDDLCVINYTSGTTGNPKGIMLSARVISSNLEFSWKNIPNKAGDNSVSMLPLAHMFGLTIEFLYTYLGNCHLYFLGKTPSPLYLMKALSDIRPYILVTVPLVMEKIVKGKIMPMLEKKPVSWFVKVPVINNIIFHVVNRKFMAFMGGRIRSITIGGAAISRPVELILKKARIPYTVGYGMTECGPLIGFESFEKYRLGSCGKIVSGMQVRIVKEEEDAEIGELQVKGNNVMTGYYKDERATSEAFTEDGWLRTGDLGLIDKAGNIFIKGRSKCMILTSNGQNIYPEELEAKLNDQQFVSESLIVGRPKGLVALIAPHFDEIKSAGETRPVEEIMESVRRSVNKILPSYSQISKVEILSDGFVHTPKHSIKRNLYN